MMNIICSFTQYTVIAAVLVAVSIGGIFVGKAIRKKSDLKKQQEAE